MKTVREKLERRWFPWAITGVLALAAAPFGLLARAGAILEYQQNPPACYGLGWGCTLSPNDIGVVMGVIWLVGVGAAASVLVVSELVWKHVALARSIFMLIFAGLGAIAWAIFGFEVFF